MATKSVLALKVSDVATMVKFMRDHLAFDVVEEKLTGDMAEVQGKDGTQLLIAGPEIEDAREYLSGPKLVFKPGDTLPAPVDNITAMQTFLAGNGLQNIQVEVTTSGDQQLVVVMPDEYKFVFVQRVQRSPEEVLALYSKEVEELEQLVAGLSEEQLNLRRTPEEWSIRMNVHHLAESETLFMPVIKTALAQSGCTYVRPSYEQDTTASELHYQERAIAPSLGLIKASRAYVQALLQSIPDGWERYVLYKMTPEAREKKEIVGNFMALMVRHMGEHLAEIRQTKHIHGL